MKNILISLFIFYSIGAIGQNQDTDKSQLKSLYVKALNNRFDLMLSSGKKYLEGNEIVQGISIEDISDIYEFISHKKLVRLLFKKKSSIPLLRVTHKIISRDTIDINFGSVSFLAKRKLHFNHGIKFIQSSYAIDCGGTNGYQPDIRFVLDRNKKEWIIESNRFIK